MSHNEIERRRRDNQRDRLEELRRVLPNTRDNKSSMVATIVRAREYIQQLHTRIGDLERMLAMTQATAFSGAAVQGGAAPFGMSMALPPIASAHPATLAPIAPRPLTAANLPTLPANHPAYTLTNITSSAGQVPHVTQTHDDDIAPKKGVPFKRGRHGSTALFTVPEDGKPNEVIHPPPQELHVSRRQSDGTEAPKRDRRDSALLLPTADPNLYLYGHRDSMQNLFAAPLPFIMQQQDQNEADLTCAKCARGINNLIMIDCDKCHTWYHIRCIGLDPERIPVHWTCQNCPQSPRH